MCKLNFHADISSKFAFKAFGEIIHKYFDLKGNYVCLVDTEVISSDDHNYRMDIAYLRDDEVINNIEFQMTPVDDEKIHVIGEYAKYILINNDKLVDSIILTNVDPNKSKDLVMLIHTLLLKPILIYISPEEITKKLNNLKNKINFNVQLDEKEELEFVILAIFAQKEIAEEITDELCYLFDQYSYIDDKTRSKIAFVLEIMLDKNIVDKKKQKKLLEVINLAKVGDSIQELINEEVNLVKKQYDNRIGILNSEISSEDEEISSKDAVISSKDKEISRKDKEISRKNACIDNLIRYLSVNGIFQ